MTKQFHVPTPHQDNPEAMPSFQQPRMGVSNSMMQEQMLASNPHQNMKNGNDANKIKEIQSTYQIAEGLAMSSDVQLFMKSNVYKAMVRLVKKEGWDPEYAASWLGQAVVETGNPTLHDLDVVERGSGKGRGMFQYTGERRGPYDSARQQAITRGQNPNDINWQIDYALDKDNSYVNMDRFREGLTDPKKNYRFNPKWGTATGKTPTGKSYGNKFSNANQLMGAYGKDKVAGYTRALTGEFTRPGTHHMDRRLKASKHILRMYKKVQNQQNNTKKLA